MNMNKKFFSGFISHAILILVSLLSVFPFIWLVSTSLKGINENIFAYPPAFIPEDFTFSNYTGVWGKVDFMRYFYNSIAVAGLTVIFNLIFSSLAGYPLARMKFAGKKVIFFGILATIMVPFQAIMVPVYLITVKLGLTDGVSILNGYIGLVMPFAVSAFGIFLMRQAFIKIPVELEESAIVDGCNVFQVLWKVVLPMVKPTLAVLAVFTFIAQSSLQSRLLYSSLLCKSILSTEKTTAPSKARGWGKCMVCTGIRTTSLTQGGKGVNVFAVLE